MQVTLTTDISSNKRNFEITKDKFDFLLQFINYLTDGKPEENSKEYQEFLSEEMNKGLQTGRVKSGNSLREII